MTKKGTRPPRGGATTIPQTTRSPSMRILVGTLVVVAVAVAVASWIYG
ncbi:MULTISPECIES: hypothetical protein [Rhizobium]|uniref:Uncharacterized protein n=1 Tax=Rhizobium bangladeshense TaxID=1138189 RepID=A0ABS7LHT3_9HYPH|nr:MULTISPECIES: hypothetical protein [Rhizobium]MBX4867376.1 hypothetical protein [Rhizobium bangladeshense]MBX4871668.1 hypothetical protein [Rhizobium bangladeshense]MBX4882982.1 hypothetical protein [Rhizobium bangladeshense]MBX4896849.1 hypothetical protein [Rhizobium bangladeshense]MBX4901109.1 hypothetical protein [Rhizobium bangladeshense]